MSNDKKSKRPKYYLTDKLKEDIANAVSTFKSCRTDLIKEVPELKRVEAIEAIQKLHINNWGIIGDTCEQIGICHKTWIKWRELIDGFAEMELEVTKHFINSAEGQLSKNIKAGKELSLIFFLKNKDPQNWRDRKEVSLSNNWSDLVKEVTNAEAPKQ